MTEIEEWRHVPNTPWFYEVSSLGRVRSVAHTTVAKNGVSRNLPTRYLKLHKNPRGGHLDVGVYVRSVHRAVAAAFIGPCPPGMEVRHKDGNVENNCVDNLEYGTRADNMQDRIKHGNNPQANRTHCPQGHPYTGENLVVRVKREAEQEPRKIRTCLACSRGRYIRLSNPELTKQEAADIAYQRIESGVKPWTRHD